MSVTVVPLTSCPEHDVAGQSMRAGIERRYPLPLTVVVSVQKIGSNCALTFRKALIVTVHVVAAPLPLQSSPQPMKTEPGLGCAVSVTTVSLRKFQAQALPQSMPGRFDVTTPEGLKLYRLRQGYTPDRWGFLGTGSPYTPRFIQIALKIYF